MELHFVYLRLIKGSFKTNVVVISECIKFYNVTVEVKLWNSKLSHFTQG